MSYLPILIIVLTILALFYWAVPSGETVMTNEMRAIAFAVMAVALALYGIGRALIHGGERTLRSLAMWLGLFAGLVTAFVFRDEATVVVDRIRGELMPSVAVSRVMGEAELRRGWDGHYSAWAEVNGVRIKMMVDTGASMVLVPYELAAELGIDPESLEFSVPVMTANGRSTVAPVTLSSIRIGSIAVFDVPAAVAQPGRLRLGLLGMSFIDRLDETSFQGERLYLRKWSAPGPEMAGISDRS